MGQQASDETGKRVLNFLGFSEKEMADPSPGGWTTWSPRDEIAPHFRIDSDFSFTGYGSLCIKAGENPAAFGAWRRIDPITSGMTYRFRACYRTRNISFPLRSVLVRIGWRDANGRRIRLPDIAPDRGTEGEWTVVEYVTTAPKDATEIILELCLAWAPNGTVWWDNISLEEEPSPPQRIVRAMTVYHRPQGMKSSAASVAEYCRVIESAADQKPDIVCLPEGITLVGTGKTYAEVSEPVPGPTTDALGSVARKLGCYIVAGLYERVGATIYNTAVLVGRDGALAGTYRKTHLPQEEMEGGLTPGDGYPVFDVDFGRVGLMICWDVQFPEPARALALRGAEIILLPIWGGSEILARARAIENHIFLITSGFDIKTMIIDPQGEIRAEATREHPVAVADLDLDHTILQPWVGDMKARTWKERRANLMVEVS